MFLKHDSRRSACVPWEEDVRGESAEGGTATCTRLHVHSGPVRLSCTASTSLARGPWHSVQRERRTHHHEVILQVYVLEEKKKNGAGFGKRPTCHTRSGRPTPESGMNIEDLRRRSGGFPACFSDACNVPRVNLRAPSLVLAPSSMASLSMPTQHPVGYSTSFFFLSPRRHGI
jgi:hypothetical protein